MAYRKDVLHLKYLSKQTFDNDCCEHGIDNFIEWNQFLEHYVHEGKAHFEIEIYTNPLLKTIQKDIQETGTVFRFMIKNVSRAETTYSAEVKVCGIRWIARVQQENAKLAVYLCAMENDLDINWFWRVTVTFKLLTFDQSKRTCAK